MGKSSICNGISLSYGLKHKRGDEVEVDLAKGTVTVGERTFLGTRLPDFLLAILQDGGLVTHRRKEKEGAV